MSWHSFRKNFCLLPGPIGQHQKSGWVLFDVCQVEVQAMDEAREEGSAAAEHDGMDGKAQFVDQSFVCQPAGELGAAEDPDVFAGFLPDLADAVTDVEVDKFESVADVGEGIGEDVLFEFGEGGDEGLTKKHFVGFAAHEKRVDAVYEFCHSALVVKAPVIFTVRAFNMAIE